MKLKTYAKWVVKNIPENTDKPEEIIQQLAVMLGIRLSIAGKFPAACGKGLDLDMDIVQAGITRGLLVLRMGLTPRNGVTWGARLYKPIWGAMQEWAWKRENRVLDSNHPSDWDI